jgi:hypothetical protein
VKTKGLEILINIKMQWMSMLEPLKCALVENKILIIKMSQENPSIVKASLISIFLVMFTHDWPCIACSHIGVYPSLDQERDVFISNFVVVVKFYQIDLFMMYTKPITNY